MKLTNKERKKYRITNKVKKVSSKDRYRLSVSRSTKNISVQIIDDVKNITLASASSNTKDIKSQNKNIKVLVFFRILVKPVTSSPTLEAPINFKSKEIVTQGAFPDALWAAVPAPASIKADK